MRTRLARWTNALLKPFRRGPAKVVSITGAPMGDLPLTPAPAGKDDAFDLGDLFGRPKTNDTSITLVPARAIDGMDIEEMRDQSNSLADSYEVGNMETLFRILGAGFTTLWGQYGPIVNQTLTTALETMRSAIVPSATVNIAERNDALKAEVKTIVATELERADVAPTALKTAQNELRDLTVQLVGNPKTTPAYASKSGQDALETFAAFLIVLTLDLLFFMGLVRGATTRNEALAFSFAVSIFGSLASYWSAMFLNKYFAFRTAVAERNACFPAGVYQDNQKPVPPVFSLPAGTMFMLILSHGLFLGILIGTAIYRNSLSHGRGVWAGTIGVTMVLVGFYMYKLVKGKSVHPRAGEHEALKESIVTLDEAVKTTTNVNFANNDAIKAAFANYNDGLRGGEKGVPAKVLAKNTLLRLIGEARKASGWFADEFTDAAKRLVSNIDSDFTKNRAETSDELERLVDVTMPEFNNTFGVDLNAMSAEANAVRDTTETEIPGRIKTLGELLPGIVTEVKAERTAIKATEVKPVVKAPVTPWTPPRRRRMV